MKDEAASVKAANAQSCRWGRVPFSNELGVKVVCTLRCSWCGGAQWRSRAACRRPDQGQDHPALRGAPPGALEFLRVPWLHFVCGQAAVKPEA